MYLKLTSLFLYAENSYAIRQKERYQATLDDYFSFQEEYSKSQRLRHLVRWVIYILNFLKTKLPSYETSIYGGRIFGRYYFLDNLFGHLEWEILNMDVPSTNTINGVQSYDYIRDNIMSLMVGGGYAQPIGSNAAITLMILWNLTEEQYSPYQNPIFRLGIAAGF